MTKYALVSDFDGTITNDDFFTLIKEKYFTEDMMAPWHRYLSGRETHFHALNEMFAQIHLDEQDLDDFIAKIDFDSKFFKVCELCNYKKIPIYICSAGCDFYIKKLIGNEIKQYGITLITNRGVYDEKHGLKMIAPEKTSPYYDEHTGVSKSDIVRQLHREGFKVVFAGDGPPDFEPAKISEVVFAKKFLKERCKKEKVAIKEFNDFDDVYGFIKGL